MSQVRTAFDRQGAACETLGSPFMGRLMPLIGARIDATNAVGRAVLTWTGDPGPSADSVPLRLAGALHALRLEGKALGDVYPPNNVSDDALWDALREAFEAHEAQILNWLASPPQTNEVRRACVILPVLAMIGEVTYAPVELFELGASGGLNLLADQFWLAGPGKGLGDPNSDVRLSPEWSGPFATGRMPRITSRMGVDLNPLNPASATDNLRLRAYLWPDQQDRLDRTQAAMRLFSKRTVQLDQGDAGNWLEAALAKPAAGTVRLVYHTVAWQYFPEATQNRALAAMANTQGPLWHLSMEGDGQPDGAAITLTTFPEGDTRALGRVDYHGRWVRWAAS